MPAKPCQRRATSAISDGPVRSELERAATASRTAEPFCAAEERRMRMTPSTISAANRQSKPLRRRYALITFHSINIEGDHTRASQVTHLSDWDEGTVATLPAT